jgi:hypothetical protein
MPSSVSVRMPMAVVVMVMSTGCSYANELRRNF